ncbi:E3 ubiquitin-protein ligase KCMF1 [Myotis davidii]|uniref:E3 ubiquitin-protein ligase KCMF1 n=1 Tax=Myotis davidii TaxID=225400 RepID=L5LE99_MYODS|nr:E3 ubiquitin-protein ligase KCMF1 [Myotis davidii]
MLETERQSIESECADGSLSESSFHLLSWEKRATLQTRWEVGMAELSAMDCVDIMPLDIALEDLSLKEDNERNLAPPPL